MKQYLKYLLKKSIFIKKLVAILIVLYLKFVYLTSRCKITYASESTPHKLNQQNSGVLFAIWHNQTAFTYKAFTKYSRLYALVSPHSDGKINESIIKIYSFLSKDNCDIILGSKNKNSIGAAKSILAKLNQGGKVIITPDGPRGPVFQINSSISALAYKYKFKVIPVSCRSTNYFCLRSWDKMIIPKPFGKIQIHIDKPMSLSSNAQENDQLLTDKLMQLMRFES